MMLGSINRSIGSESFELLLWSSVHYCDAKIIVCVCVCVCQEAIVNSALSRQWSALPVGAPFALGQRQRFGP